VAEQPAVTLRPATTDDAGLLRRMLSEPDFLGHDWPGFSDAERLVRRLQAEGLLGDDGGMLVIEVDGVAVGQVSWHAVSHGGPPGVWNIGVAIAPEARGRGTGTRAQAQLAAYLFAHTTANRVEAGARADNAAECRALEKAGFTRDGTLRGAQFKDGAWRDVAMFSRLRGD
jgi:RimJ/RimL family protein N-acetyltransferase